MSDGLGKEVWWGVCRVGGGNGNEGTIRLC